MQRKLRMSEEKLEKLKKLPNFDAGFKTFMHTFKCNYSQWQEYMDF